VLSESGTLGTEKSLLFWSEHHLRAIKPIVRTGILTFPLACHHEVAMRWCFGGQKIDKTGSLMATNFRSIGKSAIVTMTGTSMERYPGRVKKKKKKRVAVLKSKAGQGISGTLLGLSHLEPARQKAVFEYLANRHANLLPTN
jgi:hypothetical protein